MRRWLRRAGGSGAGEPKDGSGHRFNHAVKWNATSKLATRFMQFFVTVALARLLAPADFGLYGMASVVIGLVVMFAEFGFAFALIQKLTITDDDICTALTMSVTLGVAVTLACVWSAPAIAGLFHNPALTAPLRGASLSMFVIAFGITPRALLGRRMDFRSIAVADVAGSVTYAGISVSLAASGAGVWSLVVGATSMAAVQSVVLWKRAAYRFRPRFSRRSLSALLPFGARMFASNFIDFLRGNLDYFILGRGLGPAALGIYTIAFKTADFPRQRMASIVGDVALPAMSSVQEHEVKLRNAYQRAVSMSAMLTFPVLLGVTVLAPEFVAAVYGPKWLASVPALRVLLPMGVMLAVAESGNSILIAKGKPEVFLRLSIIYAAAVGLFASIGLKYGITGVAFGVLAATAVDFLLFQIALWRHVRIGPSQTMRALGVPALGSAAMVLALLAYRWLVPFSSGPLALAWLAGAGMVGLAVYGPIAWPLYKKWTEQRQRLEASMDDEDGEDGEATPSAVVVQST